MGSQEGLGQLPQQTPFEIVADTGPDGVRLRVTGELDLATAPHLERELSRVRVAGGGASVMMDLSGVTFIDLAGLAPILRARDGCNEEGGSLVVEKASSSLERLLSLLTLAGCPVTLELRPSGGDGR